MINKTLKNLAYLFYPKNICSRSDEKGYINSIEHKNLLQTIKYFHTNENINDYCLDLKKGFEKDIVLKNFRNQAMIDWQDRATIFNFSIIENNELFTISLYLSILIPFYTIKIQKNKIELFFSNIEIKKMESDNLEKRKIKEIILDIENLVESKTLYTKFPEKLLNTIIEDISFQEIPIGKFNMFNAFFTNQ